VNDSRNFWNKQARKFSVKESIEMKVCIDKFKKHIRPHMYVLDFGCGTGVSTRAVAKMSNRVIGIDYSEKMIEIARKATIEESKINYLATTIYDKKLNDSEYDVVLALNVLHLVEDTELTIRRIHQLLKPDGLFISVTPCLGERNFVIKVLFKFLAKINLLIPVNPFSIIELEKLLSTPGFTVVELSNLNNMDSTVFVVSKKNK